MKKTACEDSSRLYDINSDKFIEFLKNCAFRENFCPLSICVLRNAEYFCVFFSRKNIFFGDEKKETEKSRKIQLTLWRPRIYFWDDPVKIIYGASLHVAFGLFGFNRKTEYEFWK